MERKRSRALVAATILLAVSRLASASFNCSSAATEQTRAARLLPSVVDMATAEQSQRRHLEALFNR